METTANHRKTAVTTRSLRNRNSRIEVRAPANSIRKQFQDALTVPEKCPECGKDMRDHEKRLNFKLY